MTGNWPGGLARSIGYRAWQRNSPTLGRSNAGWLGGSLSGRCWPTASLSWKTPAAVQGKLCRRIENHIKELFVFVAEPDTPSDNNAAERSLRPLVISRKISGGTRSEQGTEIKMTLASLFGARRAQNQNPLQACRQLLLSP